MRRVQWNKYMDTAEEYYDGFIGDSVVIPVFGIGDEAAFLPTGNETVYGAVYPNEVALLVREGNLVLSFEAYAQTKIGEPRLRIGDLPSTVDVVISTAEAYMTELGAENRALVAPESSNVVGATVLPDLCAGLDPGGMGLAEDQSVWADAGPVMDRCHWQDGETDLWLSAEAVGPLDAAGLSGEEFAAWWTGAALPEDKTTLGVGDESYLRLMDPEVDRRYELDEPAVDFVIRIGNVVLQGRYDNATPDATIPATAIAESIATQTEVLLNAR